MSELGQQRHRARERALEILYEATIKDRPVEEILQGLALAPDEYTVQLVTSTEAHRHEAEALIEEFAQDWTIERLAVVDRIIMTLAIGEMFLIDSPPVAVILDEAVELAKTFSTDASASFVNGVLSSCASRLAKL